MRHDIILTNRLHDWRERHFEAAALEMQQLAHDLDSEVAATLGSMSNRAIVVKQLRFVKSEVVPPLRAAGRSTMNRLVAKANADLRSIAQEMASWNEASDADVDDSAIAAFGDLAAALGPVASGVAAASSIPALAVTTTTSFFGLVTTTSVSWPVMIVGGTVAGGLVATGAWNGSRIASKARQRLLATSRATIASHLVRGVKKPSLLEQFGAMLDAKVDELAVAA